MLTDAAQPSAIKMRYTDRDMLDQVDTMGAAGSHAALLRTIARTRRALARTKYGSARYVELLQEWNILCCFADGSAHMVKLCSGKPEVTL